MVGVRRPQKLATATPPANVGLSAPCAPPITLSLGADIETNGLLEVTNPKRRGMIKVFEAPSPSRLVKTLE
eukprot:CAMPEP_0197550932 /NCGR_PEP_ID=MMETSP1320-20131121/4358_1 /TAXON_ID=91990 /ORGANISM="Bolidomonas sp., Strain RCC2347" /LENGTH=70 /DNA_ID=CAMNT_0043111359 /DNA_START=68 /DNA_END=281 /DNA_ORIENTATION=+